MTHARQLLASATLAASALYSAGALAQEATPDTWTAVHGSQTRAAVMAELTAARGAGQLQVFTEGYMEPLATSSQQRAEVRRQTLQAIRSGEVKAINAEVAEASPAAARAMRGVI